MCTKGASSQKPAPPAQQRPPLASARVRCALWLLLGAPLGAACSRPSAHDTPRSSASPPTHVASSATPLASLPTAPAPLGSAPPAEGKRFWVGTVVGVEQRASPEPTAEVVAIIGYGSSVYTPDPPESPGEWIHVHTGTTRGWVRTNCLAEAVPATMDAGSLAVLQGFVKAARDGRPLGPYAAPELDLHMSQSDRTHGSGQTTTRVSSAVLSAGLELELPMDGEGWHAPAHLKKPHRITASVNLRETLAQLLEEICISEFRDGTLSYTSLSGYITLELKLGPPPQAPRVTAVSIIISDPG